MCILLTAWHAHARYDLVVAANRDEFHARPAAPAGKWPDAPRIVAGRDLEAGGTWLGVGRGGRFAAVTNLRRPGQTRGPRSRGLLVTTWLQMEAGVDDHGTELMRSADDYAGVNLMFADARALAVWSNADNRVRALDAGVHALSNAAPEVEWPKVTRLKQVYARHRELEEDELIDALLTMLRDATAAADGELPDTGIGLAHERVLSPIFVAGDGYGTRCSSVVLREPGGRVLFVERRFDDAGDVCGESRYELDVAESAGR